jgi:lipoprotein-anchoring transpeptidase ErfK/SrfK
MISFMKNSLIHNYIFIAGAAIVVLLGVLMSQRLIDPKQNSNLPAIVAFPNESPIEAEPEIPEPPKEQPTLYSYIEVIDSCGPAYNGACVNVRSGPGTEYPVVSKLRNGVVLKVGETAQGNDREWYKIIFDEEVRYPERIEGDWYVAKDFATSFQNIGDEYLNKNSPKTDKKIVVDRSEQTLYAYEGGQLFMQELISTGKELTPTPRGVFTVYKKTPSRYMQGPLPDISDQFYDLPGVPWNLYFTEHGAVVHGAYWHDNFGQRWSHGCVNLPYEKAKELYLWADIGTKVIVQD